MIIFTFIAIISSFSECILYSLQWKTLVISYANLINFFKKMKCEKLFNDKEIIEDIFNMKLNEKIIKDYYFLDNTEDKYKLKNVSNTVINNINLMI